MTTEKSELLGEDREVATASPSLINSKNHRRAADLLTAEEIDHVVDNWRPKALCQMCRDILEKLESADA
jgi:hypothetical protein